MTKPNIQASDAFMAIFGLRRHWTAEDRIIAKEISRKVPKQSCNQSVGRYNVATNKRKMVK